jgi:CMP-N-acetylneuraminic acid synthetase
MKGHSERVPNKNLRDFAGRPLAARILETLTRVREITRICVNTDSAAISSFVEKEFPGVIVHQRPDDLLGDTVSMNRIIAYDLSRLPGDFFLQTHSTNPLLAPRSIRKAMDAFLDGRPGHDSLFSVTRHQARFYHPDGSPVNHNPGELLRTQDLEPLYEENSCLYLFTRESFARAGARIGRSPAMFPLDPLEAVDIDEETDFLLAELLYQHQNQRG